jgi:hypothetical protein
MEPLHEYSYAGTSLLFYYPNFYYPNNDAFIT